MIPSVTTPSIAPKPAVASVPPTASKTIAPPAPDTARGSVGETAAGNMKAETTSAIDAPEQSAVAPRLRDRETAQQSDRKQLDKDTPTGPPPAFDESPLERQARVALDPPETRGDAGAGTADGNRDTSDTSLKPVEKSTERKPPEPPPTPRERAEVSFAETRSMSDQREAATLDVSR